MKTIHLIFLIATLVSCSNDDTLKFNKDEFGKEWPFSVNKIEVYCVGYKEIYCRADNGKTYALNGSAKTASSDDLSISKVEEIWLDDPEFNGLKIPYTQFVTEGLKLCENK
jgi:hypothetical protein